MKPLKMLRIVVTSPDKSRLKNVCIVLKIFCVYAVSWGVSNTWSLRIGAKAPLITKPLHAPDRFMFQFHFYTRREKVWYFLERESVSVYLECILYVCLILHFTFALLRRLKVFSLEDLPSKFPQYLQPSG